MWSAAILAGGEARRLGGVPKGALPVGGRTILERQLSLVRSLTPHIVIVAGARTEYREMGVPVLEDCIPGAGSLGGIYTAIATAPTDPVLVMACDMPFLTAPFLSRLAALAEDVDVALPRDADGRLHPLCAAWSRRAAGHLRARLETGALRILDALEGLDVREMDPDELSLFDADGALLMNVNTPDDYARAEKRTAP